MNRTAGKTVYALAATVIGLFKTEVINRRGPWLSLETAEYATLEWVAWFNNGRLFEPIGDRSSSEAEAQYYREAAMQAAA